MSVRLFESAGRRSVDSDRFNETATISVSSPISLVTQKDAIFPAGPSFFQRERLLGNGYRSFALEDYTSVPGH